MVKRDAPTHDTDWRTLYPFQSRWFPTRQGRIHYLDEGPDCGATGTLLFVHGNPTWSFHWRRLILAFREEYRCFAIDHAGSGLSDKPARLLQLDDHIENLRALIETTNLENITLVAQDWGGAIGLGAILSARERFRRIVLFNTAAFPPPYIPLRIRACRWPLLGQLLVQGCNAFSRAAIRMTLARTDRLPPEVAAGYLAPYDNWWNRRGVYGFVNDIPSRETDATWNTLSRIEAQLPTLTSCPALLVWGMRDWCFRPECLDRFAAAWPQAEIHRLSDVGHWVVEDAPEEARRLVSDFLQSPARNPAPACRG